MLTSMRVVLVAAALAIPSAAFGSGLGIPDLGAVALGQGAANVASPDDLSAIVYNPAGLVRQGGLRAMLDLRATRHWLRFQRLNADGTNPDGFETVTNEGGPAIAPMFAIAYRLEKPNLPKIAFAFGGHPSSGYSGYKFPDPLAVRETKAEGADGDLETMKASPQRYALIEQDSLSYTFALSVAVEVTEQLTVGATYQNPYVRFRSRQAAHLLTAGFPSEEFPWDGILSLDASDAFTPVGAFGASYRFPKGIDVGVSFQLPTTYDATGTLDVVLPKVADATGRKVEGKDVTLRVKTPWIARAGVKLRRDAFDAELAFTYDAWSRYDAIELVPNNIRIVSEDGASELKPMSLVKGMQDAQSVRLGGTVKLGAFAKALEPFVVRLGSVAESSAVPDERISLDQAHWARVSGNVGLGAKLGRFDLAVAYAHWFQPEKRITNSAVTQTRTAHKDKANVVGNGIYQSVIDIVDVSVSAAF